MERIEREEIMTNVLTDIKDIVETKEIEVNNLNPKISTILDFFNMKAIANKSKEEINKYTEEVKNVRGGKRVIKGTRITTKELLLIMSENEQGQNVFEYISKQYPSIDSEKKILYGALYEIKKTNTLLFILKVLLANK